MRKSRCRLARTPAQRANAPRCHSMLGSFFMNDGYGPGLYPAHLYLMMNMGNHDERIQAIVDFLNIITMNIENILYGTACMAFLLMLFSSTVSVNWDGIKEANGSDFKGFSSCWDVIRFLWESKMGVRYAKKEQAFISDGEEFYVLEDEDDEEDFKEIRIRTLFLLAPLVLALLMIFL